MTRRRYRTGLFEGDPGNNPEPPFRARGWSAEYQYLVTNHDGEHEQPDPQERRHMRLVLETRRNDNETITMVYAPEIIVLANNRMKAQQAVNLIAAACSLDQGLDISEDLAALPEDEEDLEDLERQTFLNLSGSQYATGGIARNVAIAAKATNKKKWTYAISKLWLSFRTCAVNWIEFHPQYGQRFRVESTPLNHVIFAQAIIWSPSLR